MWQKQWEIMGSGDLLASPFPLSGRGLPRLPAGGSASPGPGARSPDAGA